MTVDKAFLSRLTVEPLDRNRHDRTAFSCGIDRIDNFLKITAGRHADDDHGKLYVVREPPSPAVLGFYAISPHCIDLESLPEANRRRLPRQPTVSAIYLSMIGVTSALQGRGIGTYLMTSALRKCVEGANVMGGHFIVLDAIDPAAARLYGRIGFTALPSHPGRMLIAMRAVRQAISAAKR